MTGEGNGSGGGEANPADVDIEAIQADVRTELVRFVRALRQSGASVPANAAIPGAQALAEVGFDDEPRARAALRAALVSRQPDLATFDRLFPRFWARLHGHLDPGADESEEEEERAQATQQMPSLDALEPQDGDDESGDEEREVPLSTPRRRVVPEEADASSGERADASRYSPAGQSEAIEALTVGAGDGEAIQASVRRLTRALAGHPGRRSERTQVGRRVDTRRALRESHATGGVVLTLPERDAKHTEVRGVVLVDVSRSVLDVIDRTFLVGWLTALASEWRSLRAFLFDTDVTEVTSAVRAATGGGSTAAAFRALERAETQWGGGTRIGHAVTTLHDAYPHAVDRNSVVLVVSDGLEMGDVDDLEQGMAWLSQRAPLVLWLNPLAASGEYEPTARGMEAALPYVDGIFAFTGPEDAHELARQLERSAGGRPMGYEQDPRRPRRRATQEREAAVVSGEEQ